MGLLWSLIVGAIIGSCASKIMKTQHGFFINALLGVLGGAVGGWLGNMLGTGDGWLMNIVLSIAGACIVIWAARKLSGEKKS